MREQDALLAAIQERPDDDLPRLVYADWIEEHGEHARAAFIRAECAMADGSLAQDQWWAARRVAGDVFYPNRQTWTHALWELGAREIRYDRGFPACVTMTARRFLAAADRIRAITPVTHLRLVDVRPHLHRLADCPTLRQLLELQLEDEGLTSADLLAVLGSPLLTHLRRLSIRGNRLDAAGARQLARCPVFAHLRDLDLAANDIGDDGFQSLLSADGCRLEGLNVAANGLGPDSLSWLGRGATGRPVSLARLNLGHNPLVEEENGADLADSITASRLPGLSALNVDAVGAGAAAIRALISSTLIPAGLSQLSFQGNRFGHRTRAELERAWRKGQGGALDADTETRAHFLQERRAYQMGSNGVRGNG